MNKKNKTAESLEAVYIHTDNFREKGITLIALAVTIVVIMILAGISINAIVGDDGLIQKAQQSADLSNEAEAKETINRAILEFYTAQEYKTLYDFLQTKVDSGTIDSVVKNSDGTTLTITKNGYTVTSENKTKLYSKNNNTSGNAGGSTSGDTGGNTGEGTSGDTSTNVPEAATAETAPYYPDSTFTKKEGTIGTGLVIQDSAGNEYVWVVVPKILYNNTAYNSDGAKKPASSTDYENIEYCLQQYTSAYKNRTDYSDTYYADTDNEGWFTETEYNIAKQKMLKSVYENGGFYVGRYEAGIEANRTSKSSKNSNEKYDITGMLTPLSQPNVYPYTYVTRTQAQKLAESVNSGNKISSLMFGVQWDLVLAFMAKDTTKITSTSILTSNSITIGNYSNSVFKLNPNSQYAVYSNYSLSSTWNPATTATTNFVDSSLNKIKQSSYNGILVTTGTSEQNKVMNIYDITGNVCEWTLENTSNTNNPCAARGGSCDSYASSAPASNRGYASSISSGDRIGFRVSLY